MPAKSKQQRADEQAERQQKVRDNAKEARRPSRDDIARMLLWLVISDGHKSGEAGKPFLEEVSNDIVAGLERLGFDERESYDIWDDLVHKYRNGVFPFSPKRHLMSETLGDDAE